MMTNVVQFKPYYDAKERQRYARFDLLDPVALFAYMWCVPERCQIFIFPYQGDSGDEQPLYPGGIGDLVIDLSFT